jgi:hypothetical protein
LTLVILPQPLIKKSVYSHLASEKVIPPLQYGPEFLSLFTDKTAPQTEKPSSGPASDFELFKSSLPFSLCFDSDMVSNVQVPPLVSSSLSSIKCTGLSCHLFDVCYGDSGIEASPSFSSLSPPLIIQTIVKLWNKSKESLMPRSKQNK